MNLIERVSGTDW